MCDYAALNAALHNNQKKKIINCAMFTVPTVVNVYGVILSMVTGHFGQVTLIDVRSRSVSVSTERT